MKTFSKSSCLLCLALAALALTGSSGCGTKNFKPSKVFSLDNAWPFDGDEEEPEEGIPARVVGAWTDTVKTTPGQKAQRGFGGRLMFYEADKDKPILVDGQLVVYAFDEAGRAPTDNKPTRRYVFPPEQMKLHMSKNDMGPSYSFWLPWDDAGGPKADVSLICRFEPKGGAVITGDQTRHILPGSIPTETPTATNAGPQIPEGVPMRPAQMTLEAYQAQQQVQSAVQTAGYEAPINPQPAAASAVATGVAALNRQMSVTSIALPNDFQIPAGTSAQPIATAGSQPNGVRQAAAPAAQYQQPQQYQQPAAVMQPAPQSVQPPLTNGATMMPPAHAFQAQFQQPNAVVQRPVTIAPVNTPGIYYPQNQGYSAPIAAPQLAGQPAMMSPAMPGAMAPVNGAMVAPTNAVGRLPQQQLGTMSQQPMGMMPQQQMMVQQPTAPMQQPMAPQPGAQPLPAANGVRTAVSYGPATIPWR